MGIFDFMKSKKKGIKSETFNSLQYQTEITALAQTVYFENNHDYIIVKKQLAKEGLTEHQCNQVIENLKRIVSNMVDDFQGKLDSGEISEIKIQPNPDHKKGSVTKDQVDKYIGFGAYQMERDNLENALELFDKAIELDETATLAYANKGTLYSIRGEYKKAVAFYDKALEFDPKNIQILENKMQAFYEIMVSEGEDKFIETVKACLAVDDKSPNALMYIIQYYIKQNDLKNALKELKKLFSEYCSEQIAIQLLLNIFNRIPDKEEALREFDIIENGLSEEAKYQLDYCKALYLKGIDELEEAIVLFEQLNKINPFSWNYYQIAIIKNLQNKESESFEYLEKTFQLEPELKEDAKQYIELKNLWTHPTFIKLTSI